MTQAQWATELANELCGYQGLRITTLELLDALGSCGLELTLGDGAAAAFWESLIAENRQRLEEGESR